MDFPIIRERIEELARRFAAERLTRQQRTALDPADFEALRGAGYPLLAVPVEHGGSFVGWSRSIRPLCDILRSMGRGDASVALVCAMHPAVLGYWLAPPAAASDHHARWQQQREQLFHHVRQGAFFGTITSEPGSGGDVSRTRAVARRTSSGYVLDGQKHFGSGSGVTSFMITSAIPEGETEPDWFLLDVRGVPWDGSRGMTLLAPWDGYGMAATQSHGMSFSGFPALRYACPGRGKALAAAVSPFVCCLFASVITGVVDAAMEIAQAQLAPRQSGLRPFEKMEWARAEIDAWLVAQALEGMLNAAEAEPPRDRAMTLGKLAIAELAESCLTRLCRVLGGGSYSRRSPIGHMFEDVRALGFLRPPWGLAYDNLMEEGA
jgi:alkylation response protein AidB-like acyl-CoA dehydrogenase